MRLMTKKRIKRNRRKKKISSTTLLNGYAQKKLKMSQQNNKNLSTSSMAFLRGISPSNSSALVSFTTSNYFSFESKEFCEIDNNILPNSAKKTSSFLSAESANQLMTEESAKLNSKKWKSFLLTWPNIRLFLFFVLLISTFLTRVDAYTNHVPSPPRNVQVTQINSSTIKVEWEPPADEQAEVFGYNVYKFQILNDAFVNNLRRAVAIVDRNKLYAYLNDLEPNTEYAIRVGAFNMKGDGELSQLTKQSRILTGGKPPSPPRPQSISLINEFKPIRAKVEWLPPRFTYNLPLKRYILWWKPVELEAFQRAEVQPTEQSFVLDHLYSGQEYVLHIAAVNEVGASENATEQLITPTGVPDGEPLNIRYTIFRNKLSILWDPPQWRHRNGNITHYEVELVPISSRTTGPTRRNVSSQTAIFDIDPAQSYAFRVAAATSKGTGIYSGELRIDGQQSAAISPPKNVRVQTVSNSSVVVQWDFDEVDSSEAGQPDGFMVKYVPEPSVARESTGMDKWRSQPVMDPKARHLEINRLITQKSYAFCVLAMKQRRLGPCSDPPITLVGPLRPTFVVQNLRLEYRTSQSVKIRWDYQGPAQIGFYIKQMGQKSYLDQDLVEKSMVSPQFEKRVNGTERELFLANLRPYMNYTFQVGVFSLEDGRHYWPRELQVQTDPRGPPFVEAPEFIQSDGPNTAQFRLSPASEEYGPISHYWLIVVPGNYSKEEVTGADKSQLQIATRNFRTAKTAHLQQLTVSSTSRSQKDKKIRRNIDNDLHGNISTKIIHQSQEHLSHSHAHHQLRQRRHQPHLDGIYIAAQLPSHEMQRLYREELTFTLGDGLEYDGYMNFPLDPDVAKYHLMSRAFARDETWRKAEHPFDYRPPMQEPVSKMHTDSALSEQFSTRVSSLFAGPIRGSGIMFPLLAVGIILFVMAVMIGMLFLWWFRCKRGQSMRGGAGMHKVPLTSRDFPKAANANGNGAAGGTNGALPTETSKLLLGMDQDGRPVMNSYDRSGPNATDLHDASAPLLYSDTSATLQMDHPMLSMSSGNLYGGIGQPQNYQQFHSASHPMDNRLSGSGHLNVATMPIPLAEFATHIDRQKMANSQGFIQEFESIDTGQQFTWENSAMEVNKHKNRYANVVAYDHSRVILPPEDDADEELPGNDYINANYIDGYDKPKAYIATQGPLPETFADFWRMIWEERARTIVMLTRLEERARTKCDQYWPTRGTTLYGNYKITLMETTELAHYCLRTLRLENVRCRNELGRDIQHCQFTAWPDHGVPIHPTPFLMFLKRVKALNPVDAGPIVTHCSAGIGRTGAFIVIDWQLDRLRYENSVDIYGCVRAIRSQRQYMVQTDDQYIFIHDALLDAAQSGSTEIPSSKLLQHVQTLSRPQMHNEFSGIDIEFNTLLSLKPPKCFRAQVANAVYNGNKNVKLSVVPWDFNRVELPREAGADGGDYINASWIDGYRSRNAYIATQLPLANTVFDFWRMLWVHDCSIVAMLARQPNDPVDKFYEYWPSPGYPENYNGLSVDFVSEFDMTHYWVREFKCTDENRHSRTIRQFQFIDWADDSPRQLGGGSNKDVPQCPEKFVDFVRQVHQTKQQFGSTGPICVHCLDGAGRTGTFCAVSLTIDRAKLEHVVDMFTTVKLLRMQRPQMVENREQYEFCYRAAIQFLAQWDEHY